MAEDVTSFVCLPDSRVASNGIFLSKAPIIKQGIVWFRFLLVMMANYSHSSDYLIVELVWIDALNNISPPKKNSSDKAAAMHLASAFGKAQQNQGGQEEQ